MHGQPSKVEGPAPGAEDDDAMPKTTIPGPGRWPAGAQFTHRVTVSLLPEERRLIDLVASIRGEDFSEFGRRILAASDPAEDEGKRGGELPRYAFMVTPEFGQHMKAALQARGRGQGAWVRAQLIRELVRAVEDLIPSELIPGELIPGELVEAG